VESEIERFIRVRFDETLGVIRTAEQHLASSIASAAQLLTRVLTGGGTVFVFGNGGSAADAQHFACELVGRFLKDRRALRAEALVGDVATITALANDFGYDAVFARQLQGKARPGDAAVGLSTSGNSPSVVAGLATARQMGLATVAVTGAGGGRCAELADVLLDVPSTCTPRIQEAHGVIYHILCELIEQALCSDE